MASMRSNYCISYRKWWQITLANFSSLSFHHVKMVSNWTCGVVRLDLFDMQTSWLHENLEDVIVLYYREVARNKKEQRENAKRHLDSLF